MRLTEITRPDFAPSCKRYASNSTDQDRALVAPLMPPKLKVGRPRRTNKRAVWGVILYIASTGCQSNTPLCSNQWRTRLAAQGFPDIHDGAVLSLLDARQPGCL